MKNRKSVIALSALLFFALTSPVRADVQAPSLSADNLKNLKIGVVNFKLCVEKSKMGKQEQASFEALKKQMETVFGEKEKALAELADKLEDLDYLDSLSPEAETELKRKYRALSQEASQLQNQYYQALNQAQFKVVQMLSEATSKATEIIATANGLDVVLNEESSFYFSPKIDISEHVIQVMDQRYDEDQKNVKPGEKKA
jgi:outer membrane protein